MGHYRGQVYSNDKLSNRPCVQPDNISNRTWGNLDCGLRQFFRKAGCSICSGASQADLLDVRADLLS